jgi:glyoxylase-like metal-dependent hydrolase (beta-lactamase superfamily II)
VNPGERQEENPVKKTIPHHLHLSASMTLAILWMLASPLAAQAPGGALGLGPAQAAGPKLPPPSAFPAPGTFFNTTGVSLLTSEPGAEIRFTMDGSGPTATSPVFNQEQVMFLAGVYEGDRGLKTGYTIRAIATKPGFAPSDPATFAYQMERRDRTAYVSEIVAQGIRMIRDSDNDKMYLVEGTQAFALIDSGLGRGDLRAYLTQFTRGLPIHGIFTHNHGDHIGQASAVIDWTAYIGAADRAGLVNSLRQRNVPAETIERNAKSLEDGDTIDLGDRALIAYATPGHTAGSIVILDPKTGVLFTGDSFGNNSPLPPDVMWMQGSRQPLDEYFATVLAVRRLLGDRVKTILTGHNDRPLVGTKYLDNLETALQNLMDRGDAALVPSLRPANLVQTVVGDRMQDPDWFGMNVNRQTYLPAPPDQIASIVDLQLTGAKLGGRVNPRGLEYVATAPVGVVTIQVRPASTRIRGLTIDGKAVSARQPVEVAFTGTARTVPIVVTAPDGTTTLTYQLTLKRE